MKPNFQTSIIPVVIFFLFLCSNRLSADGYTYQWGHPSPQGNSVYGIAFQDETTGWAVTACGNILITTNGGEHWEIIRSSDSLCTDLYDILISEQGTLIASGDHGMILRSTNEGLDWDIISFPEAGRLYDLAPIPGGGLSAAGQNGKVLVSFDDGVSWTDVGPGGTGYARHHYWKNELEAYVVGFGMFYRTIDGGDTWVQLSTPPSFGLNEIYFVNENTGYAVEDFGYFKTMDGGTNWTHVPEFSGIVYRFRTLPLDEMHWLAVTFVEGAELWETLDGGENWQQVFDRSSTGAPCILKNGNRLFFSTDIGDIFYSDDLGLTVNNGIQNISVFPSAPITIIGKRADGTLFANNQPNSGTNNQTFYRSDDNGASWYTPVETPGLRWITDIKFFNDQYGVAGSYDDIRFTLNGGDLWNSATLPVNYNLVNFSLPAADRFFAGAYTTTSGGGGNIYRSADQGATWQVVGGGLPGNGLYIPCIAFADENNGYVSCLSNGQPEIYKTTDGGESWNLINQTGISGYIAAMLWLDENTGLAAVPNDDFGIFRTTDGGLHWTEVCASGARILTMVEDGRIGAVNPNDDVFIESLDGGITWTFFPSPFGAHYPGGSSYVTSIMAIEDGYVLGGDANRLMTAHKDVTTATNPDKEFMQGYSSGIFSVSPNPLMNYGSVKFFLKKSSKIKLTVIDMQGRTVFSIPVQYLPSGNHEIRLDGNLLKSKMNSGSYFITLVTDDSFDSEKVIFIK